MSETKSPARPGIQTFRTNHGDVRAYGHATGNVTLSVSRHNDTGSDFFLACDAHLTPLLARELAGALCAAADFAEGVDR